MPVKNPSRAKSYQKDSRKDLRSKEKASKVRRIKALSEIRKKAKTKLMRSQGKRQINLSSFTKMRTRQRIMIRWQEASKKSGLRTNKQTKLIIKKVKPQLVANINGILSHATR